MASLSRSSVAASTLDFWPEPKDNALSRRLTGLATNAPENNDLRENLFFIAITDGSVQKLTDKFQFQLGPELGSVLTEGMHRSD